MSIGLPGGAIIRPHERRDVLLGIHEGDGFKKEEKKPKQPASAFEEQAKSYSPCLKIFDNMTYSWQADSALVRNKMLYKLREVRII